MALGIGLTITNSKAVIEALVGHQTAFARTPKYRVVNKKDKAIAAKKYRKRLGWIPYIEMLIGAYFALTVWYADRQRELLHRAVPVPVRVWLLVHRADVAAARPLRRAGAGSGRGAQCEAVPGWGVGAAWRFRPRMGRGLSARVGPDEGSLGALYQGTASAVPHVTLPIGLQPLWSERQRLKPYSCCYLFGTTKVVP